MVNKSTHGQGVSNGRMHGLKSLRPARFIIVAVGLFILFFTAYGIAYCAGWKFSFTNASYYAAPFNNSGEGKGPSLSDVADNILPIASATFHPFNLTAWLPLSGIGNAQGMDIYLSPLNYLYLLPLGIAQPLVSAVKVAVAFVAMFFYVRQLGCSWRGSFISGASYAMCSTMIIWNGWQHSTVVMYAPLLFLLLEKMLAKLSIRYYVALAVVVYLMLVAGMPTYAAYFLYFAGAYMLFYGIRTYRGRLRRLGKYLLCFFIAVVLGGLASLPYTASLLTSVGTNGYASSRADFATATLWSTDLQSALFPYVTRASGVSLNEGMLYVGTLAVISLPLTFIHFGKKQRVGFFAVSSLILAVLIYTHLGDMFFKMLPLVNTSLKFRILVLLNFSLAVLVGLNMDDLLKHKSTERTERYKIWVAAGIAVIVFAVIAWYQFPVLGKSSQSGVVCFYISVAMVALFFAVVVLETLNVPKIVASGCTVVLIFAVSGDMGYFASQFFPFITQSSSTIPLPTDTVKYLQRGTANAEKIITVGAWDFFPMQNMYYGISSINGHNFVYTNPDVAAYYTAISPDVFSLSSTRTTFTNISNVNLLKYMGVKYVVGDPATISGLASKSSVYGNVSLGKDNMAVSELNAYAPFIELTDSVQVHASDSGELKAMESSYNANTVNFSVETGSPQQHSEQQTALSSGEKVSNITLKPNGDVNFTVSIQTDRYVLVNQYDDGNWAAYVDGQKTRVSKGTTCSVPLKCPKERTRFNSGTSPPRRSISLSPRAPRPQRSSHSCVCGSRSMRSSLGNVTKTLVKWPAFEFGGCIPIPS